MIAPWNNDGRGSDTVEVETGLIDVDGVVCSYSGSDVNALDGFSLLAQPGEFVSVLGRSGCGKTTALRVMAGFERASGGYVRLGGRLVASSFVHVPPNKRRLGLVFQDYALFPHLSVERNIAFGISGLDNREKRRRISPLLDLTGLAGLEKRYVHELSGGQQQRVAIARALAPEPVALLLDEPFSSIDRAQRVVIRRDVRRIAKEAGATTILVTHDREEALGLADRIAIMGEGRVDQMGRPDEVYAAPTSPEVATLIGPCGLVPGVMRGREVVTAAGAFPVNGAAGALNDGAGVLALLRASELELKASTDGPEARVTYREFRGEYTEYGVRIPSGLVVRVRKRSSELFNEGDRVAIKERPGHAIAVFERRG